MTYSLYNMWLTYKMPTDGRNPEIPCFQSESIRSEEGLMLEMSPLRSLCGGQFTFISLLINQTFISSPHRHRNRVGFYLKSLDCIKLDA